MIGTPVLHHNVMQDRIKKLRELAEESLTMSNVCAMHEKLEQMLVIINKLDHKNEHVLFIEFSHGMPFSVVTSADARYDIDQKGDALYYHKCAQGGCYPVCNLKGRSNKYWSADSITVATFIDNAPCLAPTANRVELPGQFKGLPWEWENAVERE